MGATLLAVAGTTAFAEDANPRQAVIVVSGEGQSAIAPDTALVTLSVVKQAKSAHDALDENNKAMGAVLATLKDSGIAERDLQTSGFSIQPQYNYSNGTNGQPQPPELIGYQATNSVSVRVRDLAKLGSLIDQAVGLGINQGGDIQFINDKPDAVLDEARKNAVANALAKARTLSEAAGVKLGRVIEISEDSNRPAPQPVFRAAMMKQATDSVPVQSGENTYNVTVTITYSIEQ
ncbi:SIMPL domain-containing protein [Rhizobium tubonense]